MIDWSRVEILKDHRGVILDPETGEPFVLAPDIILFLKEVESLSSLRTDRRNDDQVEKCASVPRQGS